MGLGDLFNNIIGRKQRRHSDDRDYRDDDERESRYRDDDDDERESRYRDDDDDERESRYRDDDDED